MTLKKKQEVETKGIGEIESEEGGKNPHSFWHQTLKFEKKIGKLKEQEKESLRRKKNPRFFYTSDSIKNGDQQPEDTFQFNTDFRVYFCLTICQVVYDFCEFFIGGRKSKTRQTTRWRGRT